MSIIDEVRKLASECNCSYKPFSQLLFFKDDIRVGKGLCFGFTISWLEGKSKGINALDNTMFNKDTVLEKHYFQLDESSLKDNFILSASIDKDGGVKSKSFTIFSDSSDISAMLSWVTPLFKNRYFVIQTGRHAMGITNTKFGKCIFFDPNCGEVSGDVTNMNKFLSLFFKHNKIKSNYWDNSPYTLNVSKYQ